MRGTTRRLLELSIPFTGRIALSMLLGALTVAAGIGLLSTSAYLIARAALHPSIAELQVAIVGVRFFGIARGVFRYLERLQTHNTAFRLLARLRVWFYEHLEPLAPARLLSQRSGDLLSRIVADIETLQHFFLRVITPPGVAVAIIFAVTFFMSRFDLWLSVQLLFFLSLVGLALPLLTKRLAKPFGESEVELRSTLNAALVDGVQGNADILAFEQGPSHLDLVSNLTTDIAGTRERNAWVAGLSIGLVGLTTNLAVVAALLRTIPLVQIGMLEGYLLAVVVIATIASFEAVAPIPDALQHLESSLAAAGRLFDIVDAPPAVIDPESYKPLPESTQIHASKLTFRYAEALPSALRELDFDITPGHILAVIGPSGSGKSSIAHLLLRFWDYSEGEILVGGTDLRSFRLEELRSLFSVISQDTYLFHGSIRDNLLYARPDAGDAEIFAALEQAQLLALVHTLPQALDTPIGERGLMLSGGERQRLSITRALLRDAPIWIADEPTANLDPLTEYEVMRSLIGLMRERTSLLLTHRLIQLEDVDEILVLQEGRVIERGDHSRLLKAHGLYYRMWSHQRQADGMEIV
ncbi:MAG: thiol reductant ABC exporter subunit CydC [Anaerolineales bacterium]|nr:thiol reductant ABC exporter subunit CydC [Anaerolineales bacterium]